MTNLISETCRNCGKGVKISGYYPEVGCVCSADCHKAIIVPKRLRQAGIDKGLYREMRLDNYKFQLQEDGLQERLYNYLKNPNHKGWAFFGSVGTGKTHLAVAMAREMIERFMLKTRVIDVPALMSSLYDNMTVDGRVQYFMELYKEIDLLVLDDLGAEKSSPYAVQQMYLIMNYRLVNQKLTFITSNLTVNEIFKTISDRIASRILPMCRPVILTGDDYRLKK